MTLHSFYTDKGRALAAKIAAGTTEMTVTRVVAGSGHTADIPSATDLPEQKQTLSVGLPSVSGTTATLPVTLLEAQAASDYALTELGVYANDPDEGDILFQVCQLTEAEGITAGGEGVLRFYLRQSIGAEGVTVTCSPAGIVLEEDIAELRKRAEYADHRNLLDNPWFTVNQRGQTTYTTPYSYTVDRWKNGSGAITIENGVQIGNTRLDQPLEPTLAQWLKGKPVTVSVLQDNGKIDSFSSTFPATEHTEKSFGSFKLLFGQSILGYGISYPVVAIGNVQNLRFRAIKLELGSVSTLANDVPPNYAEELMKCQRYFQRFKTQALRPTDKDDFRPVMRVDPAVSTITVGGVTYYTATADL